MGMCDMIEVLKKFDGARWLESQDHLAVSNPAVQPGDEIPNFLAGRAFRDDEVLIFVQELARDLVPQGVGEELRNLDIGTVLDLVH